VVLPKYVPNVAWVSPTASNSRKMDFFTMENGEKSNQNTQKNSVLSSTNNASAPKKHRVVK